MIDLLQIPVLVLAVLLGLLAPRYRASWFRALSRSFNRLARRRVLSIVLVGLLAFILSGLVSLLLVQPKGHVHDEFSYLLAADTFAHGRLSNPPHPMWEHFESFHIIQQPTYASKYLPAQGLFLAAGQVVTGQPIVGVWLSVGLCGAAICWMLQGWVTPRWAFLGAVLVVIRLVFFGPSHTDSIVGYWSQSYYGGAVPALGGALLFGALRHLIRGVTTTRTLIFALGLALLATSRPFEGLVVSAPAGVLLLIWLFRGSGLDWGTTFRRVILPIALILTMTAGGMAYYNYRTTGRPDQLAYEVHDQSYGVAPFFLWQSMRPVPEYNHSVMEQVYAGAVRTSYARQQSPQGFLNETRAKLITFGNFYLCFAFAVCLPALPWTLGNRWTRFALFTCFLLMLALAQETWFIPHYAAPAACLLTYLLVQMIRQVRLWHRRGRRLGRFLARGIVAAVFLAVIPSLWLERHRYPTPWEHDRADMIATLCQGGGKHLVVVRYASDNHRLNYEWVYNEADIDGSRVVWAREMDLERNRRLLAYFHDRRVWLLEPDVEEPLVLVPYQLPAPDSEGRSPIQPSPGDKQ